MHLRIALSGMLLLALATDAVAQNRFRWRPRAILDGVTNTVKDVARDVRNWDSSAITPEERPGEDVDHPDHRADPLRAEPLRQSATGWSAPRQSDPGPQAPRAQAVLAVSADDVIKMVKSGLSESMIIQYITDNGVKQHLNVSDLIRLHEQGVSEPVLSSMQKAEVVGLETPQRSVFTNTNSPRPPSHSSTSGTSSRGIDVQRFGPSILVPR